MAIASIKPTKAMITVCITSIGIEPVNEAKEGRFISGIPDGINPTTGPL